VIGGIAKNATLLATISPFQTISKGVQSTMGEGAFVVGITGENWNA